MKDSCIPSQQQQPWRQRCSWEIDSQRCPVGVELHCSEHGAFRPCLKSSDRQRRQSLDLHSNPTFGTFTTLWSPGHMGQGHYSAASLQYYLGEVKVQPKGPDMKNSAHPWGKSVQKCPIEIRREEGGRLHCRPFNASTVKSRIKPH